MRYQAIISSSATDWTDTWLVTDEQNNTISKHSNREAAEQEAERLNSENEVETMNKKELIVELLENMNDVELLSVHREYINKTSRFDDEIYTLDDLDMIAEGEDAYWLLCRAYYGDFDPTADYFKFNGYGNLQSIYSYELSEYIDFKEIAEYCVENDNDFYNDDIRGILEEEDEEDEEQ